MKISFFVLILLTSLLLFPRTYKYWPTGKAQDYAFLWVNGDQVIHLFELAEQFKYKNVFVCPNRTFPQVTLDSGERLKNLQNDVSFQQFSNEITKSDLTCFLGRKMSLGMWSISGSSDQTSSEKGSKKVLIDINRSYFISDKMPNPQCQSGTSEEINLKACSYHLFGNWFMREEVLTRPFPKYNEET